MVARYARTEIIDEPAKEQSNLTNEDAHPRL
jgi:hypothetical protein